MHNELPPHVDVNASAPASQHAENPPAAPGRQCQEPARMELDLLYPLLDAAECFFHYSMPDWNRSRPSRLLLKSAGAAAQLSARFADPQMPARLNFKSAIEPEEDAQEQDNRLKLLFGLGVAASIGVAIGAEVLIYRFGERRRARGKRFAHTLPAFALGGLIGTVEALERNLGLIEKFTTPQMPQGCCGGDCGSCGEAGE